MSELEKSFDYFDAIYCINLPERGDRWSAVQNEFRKVGILGKVIRFNAVKTPKNGHIGCMLSHRAIIEEAKKLKMKNVLVFEDDIFFRFNLSYYEKLILSLSSIKAGWCLFYFGGLVSPFRSSNISSINSMIFSVSGISYAHAIVYSSKFFDFFLKNIPTEKHEIDIFIQQWKYFDSWLFSLQDSHLTLACKNFSVFQDRKTSDTSVNASLWSYYKQYFYLFFKYPILRYIFYPFFKVKVFFEIFIKKVCRLFY